MQLFTVKDLSVCVRTFYERARGRETCTKQKLIPNTSDTEDKRHLSSHGSHRQQKEERPTCGQNYTAIPTTSVRGNKTHAHVLPPTPQMVVRTKDVVSRDSLSNIPCKSCADEVEHQKAVSQRSSLAEHILHDNNWNNAIIFVSCQSSDQCLLCIHYHYCAMGSN